MPTYSRGTEKRMKEQGYLPIEKAAKRIRCTYGNVYAHVLKKNVKVKRVAGIIWVSVKSLKDYYGK